MVRNFNTLEIILDYSVRYPNFYLCRGNHDMLLEANVGKFDDEGKRMKRFVQSYGGDSLVDKWGGFEAELGLLAMQGNTVFSHTFGTNPLDLEAIRTRDRAEQQKVVWGDHTKLPIDKLEALYETNCRNLGISPEDSVWCVGHRAVDPGLEQQLGGRLIHLNDAKDLPVGWLDGRFQRFIEL